MEISCWVFTSEHCLVSRDAGCMLQSQLQISLPLASLLVIVLYHAPAGSLRDRAFYPFLTSYGWQHGKTLGRPLSEAAVA